MTIRRTFGSLLLVVLVAVCLVLTGLWLIRARLAAMGVEHLSASGIELGWNRLAFDTLNLTWSGAEGALAVQSNHPSLTLDWSGLQLDRFSAGPTRVSHSGSHGLSADAPAPHSGNALELTLPETLPFWLPRHLDIESLQADVPCQGARCRFDGRLSFDRGAETATAEVDASLTRNGNTLAIEGDVRLGVGPDGSNRTAGELRVDGLRTWLPAAMSPEFRRLVPSAARVRFTPAGEMAPGTWPLGINVTTEGGAQPAFSGRVVLHTADPWRLEIDRGELTATLDQWQQNGWLLDQLQAAVFLNGTVTADQTRLTLAPATSFSVRHMDPLEARELMWLDNLKLSPAGMTISVRNGQLAAMGPVTLTAGEVRYPGLITQSWRADTSLQWQRTLTLEGTLGNGAGLVLPVQLDYQPAGPLKAELSMELTPDNEANHLAETLTAWPPDLVMSEGRVDAVAQVLVPPDGAPEFSGAITFSDASGILANTAWQELSGKIRGHVNEADLVLETGSLELSELNPGIPIGPVRTAVRYQAATGSPQQGRLALERVSAGFAGGTVTVADDTTLDLADESWQIPVEMQGIQLSALMNLYPTEGLAGEGTLEGTLPVTIGPAGVRIEGGRIAALPPGGRLQLPADRLGGVAQGNPAMALVTRAMQNFHYRLLESTIDYQENGTLLLDLKLRGSSPEVDSDRPVVLNINLQEDIPALLTSLQLSGRVNEAVTERVRERLRQEGVDTD